MASAVVVVAAGAGGVPVRKYSPMCRLAASVNQTLPFGPAAIPVGSLPTVGAVKRVIWPSGVIRPILLASGSVNQRLPSGPAAIDPALTLSAPTLNVVTLPVRLIRWMKSPANKWVWVSHRGPDAHRLPSGPVVTAGPTPSAT